MRLKNDFDHDICKRTTFLAFCTWLNDQRHSFENLQTQGHHKPKENNAFRWLIHAWLSKNMALLLERHAHLA